jgi:hypothetical protein
MRLRVDRDRLWLAVYWFTVKWNARWLG